MSSGEGELTGHFSPAPRRTERDTLASLGPQRSRRLPPSPRVMYDPPVSGCHTICFDLRCPFTPSPLQTFHHYYEQPRPLVQHRYCQPCELSACAFLFTSTLRFLQFRKVNVHFECEEDFCRSAQAQGVHSSGCNWTCLL